MTAEAAEQDQADVPEPPSWAQHVVACFELRSAAAGRLAHAVAAELAEEIPALEQAWLESGDKASASYAALEAPRTAKQERDAAVAQAEAELAGWRSQAEDESTPFAERVRLRAQIADGEAELEVLRQKADFAQAQLLPLLDAYAKAEAGFEQAESALEGRKLNATPALAFLGAGSGTAVYKLFRFGTALEAALRDRDHPEHVAAVGYWLHLCRVSGLRTEDFAAELPSDAEQAKRYWDQVYADANPPQPPPSGREVAAAVHAEMTVMGVNKALENSPARIDDYRRPGPPREVPDRPYMQVPKLRDMGIR